MDQTIPLLLSSTSSAAAVNNKKKKLLLFITIIYLFFCWLTMRIGFKRALHRSNRWTHAVPHEA